MKWEETQDEWKEGVEAKGVRVNFFIKSKLHNIQVTPRICSKTQFFWMTQFLKK